jgi:Putative Na+/H+ antiporter
MTAWPGCKRRTGVPNFTMNLKSRVFICLIVCWLAACAAMAGSVLGAPPSGTEDFPRPLQSYVGSRPDHLAAVLVGRVRQEPFNLVATLIFLCAIAHTFIAAKFTDIAHRWDQAHAVKKERGTVSPHSVHHGAELFHFLGEVEVVFGLWAVVLVAAIVLFFGWTTAVDYLTHKVNFTEAMFVVVIMALAASRPILRLAEAIMEKIAGLLGGSLTAWWLTVLTLGPLLGSVITEPAAMTISALILARQFFALQPGTYFKYATIGLLFVNVSVGGTLTHFAAPPVLMVAGPWNWDTAFMLTHFGWKAFLGILASNGLYWLVFRTELKRLQARFAVRLLKHQIITRHLDREELETELESILAEADTSPGALSACALKIEAAIGQADTRLGARFMDQMRDLSIDPHLSREAFDQSFNEIKRSKLRRHMPFLLPKNQRAPFHDPDWDQRDDPVPAWVTVAHLLFMAWTVLNAHHPQLFVPGLLFFLGFARVTAPYQNRIDLSAPMLVGFFLGGLVIHGGLQGWWIAPVLGSLARIPLMLGATVLTAFNDNAAITYLSTLVPDFSAGLKYAVMAGAVAGGGLTVIANAPNPAGQTLLKPYFDGAVAPGGLLAAALLPTLLVWLSFALL